MTDLRPLRSNPVSGPARDAGFALLAIAAVVAASIVGQIATYPNLAPWYAGLGKPPFNPPNWIFAPVWTTLYLLMAFALWRILRLAPATAGRRWALIWFFAQLVLNAAWSWLFFAAHSPVLGLIDIVPQLIAVVVTTALYHAPRPQRRLVSRPAGLLGRVRERAQSFDLVAQPRMKNAFSVAEDPSRQAGRSALDMAVSPAYIVTSFQRR